MKIFLSITILFASILTASAQKVDEILATATGLTFTPSALSENIRKAYVEQDQLVADERRQLYTEFVRDFLLEAEAKAANITRDDVITAELKKVAEPSEADVKTVFDANKSAFGERKLDEVRPQIVAFLKNGLDQKAIADLTERLKAKHKFVAGKDPNSPGIKPADILFTLNASPFTVGEFDRKTKALIYDIRSEIAEEVIFDLENAVFSALVSQEAKARSIEASDLIAVEISNKLKAFTDEEREALETDLKKRLFAKYAVNIKVREPAPVPHDVTADDDPVFGKADSAVTVIMFSDFQCSACSATHPVLKRVLQAYGDKARLVVRDFPLETVHAHAFHASLAANAARQQGKFFEYIELLYGNQESLDDASLKNYAVQLGLNAKQFELDFISEKTSAEVRKDMADGLRAGARGTPTIFVNGLRVHHLSANSFRRAIDQALSRPAARK